MKKITFLNIANPVLVYIIAFVPYTIIYYIVNYDGIDSLIFFFQYLGMFVFTIIVYRFLSFLFFRFTGSYKINKFLGIGEIVIILLIFLFLSSLIISPMSFLFIVAPLKRNILSHLFVISLAIFLVERHKSKIEHSIN